MKIEQYLSQSQLKSFSKDELIAINESIANEISNTVLEKTAGIEKENAKKFDTFVENITKKFDDQVNGVIIESVKNNISKNVDNKFYSIVSEMVNLLENSGITTTQKSKDLLEKLELANTKLKATWDDREKIKKELNGVESENFILNELKGMNPNIVNAALEHFKGKDIMDIQDGLEGFLDGDMSEYLGNDKDDNDFAGELDLDQVQDALEKINAKSDENSGAYRKNSAAFESLSKGLKKQKIVSSPSISESELDESAKKALIESSGEKDVEDDVKDTMSKIADFNDIGYNFK